jgi:tRNA-specific 2-thiouridylase
LGLADRLGAAKVATGHYARIEPGEVPRLRRAKDLSKDQSYFLHMLGPEVLSRLEFPLGESTKAEVREEAARLGLPGADKGESQELCFVPTGRYDRFVSERAKDRVRPGPIVDAAGREVGRHDGIHQFTRGQRKNLGVALGHRAYVVGIEPDTGTVRLGEGSELCSRAALLDDVTFAAGTEPPLRCGVSVRYRGEAYPAEVSRDESGGARVAFDAPVRAVVPGQFAVFYRDDAVLGGGLISRAEDA